MVGSCGKTENRNRYRDILKNRYRNRYRLLKKPTKKTKTDTDLKNRYRPSSTPRRMLYRARIILESCSNRNCNRPLMSFAHGLRPEFRFPNGLLLLLLYLSRKFTDHFEIWHTHRFRHLLTFYKTFLALLLDIDLPVPATPAFNLSSNITLYRCEHVDKYCKNCKNINVQKQLLYSNC